jgi:ribose-phosphate pyrophosphokinase
VPYKKSGAPQSVAAAEFSVPPTPGPGVPKSAGLENGTDVSGLMSRASLQDGGATPSGLSEGSSPVKKSKGVNGLPSHLGNGNGSGPGSPLARTYTTHNYENPSLVSTFQAKPGYKQWVAQAGTLVADLLTCAGADHIVRVYSLFACFSLMVTMLTATDHTVRII